MAANWIVRVKYSGKISEGWDYPGNWFPRTFHSKQDAEACAEEARQKGGRNISIVKENVQPTKERIDENNGMGIQASGHYAIDLSPAGHR